MELTQEYFDQKLGALAQHLDSMDKRLDRIPTKIEMHPLAMKVDIRDGGEALARVIAETVAVPMQERFDQLHAELTARDRIEHLETDLQKIKQALHIS